MCLRARCWVRGYNMVRPEMSSIIIIYPGYCPSQRWSCMRSWARIRIYHENVTGCNWLLFISSYLAIECLVFACGMVHLLHRLLWLLCLKQFCTQDKHASGKETHILGNCNKPEEDLHINSKNIPIIAPSRKPLNGRQERLHWDHLTQSDST